MKTTVKLTDIYECFCDATRLRILRVLAQGPLCVCHFQAVLREPQVKISKHLSPGARPGRGGAVGQMDDLRIADETSGRTPR